MLSHMWRHGTGSIASQSRPVAQLSEIPPRWDRPPLPLGSNPAAWA